MGPLKRYLTDLREIRNSGEGVPETSFYPALSNLLNEIGASMNPRVRAILTLANRGAGMPDGGFFTAEQFTQASDDDLVLSHIPERGALEVKPLSFDVRQIAASDQVQRYLVR